MRLLVLAGVLLLAGTSIASADCYGWRRASDFGRNEDQWQCGECLERGHMPAPGKMGATFCTAEAKQNGETVYIARNIPFTDFDTPANSFCGCGQFVLD